MNKTNRLSATYHNQVQMFLVEYCEEEPEYETRLFELHRAYCRVHKLITNGANKNLYSNRWMSDSSLHKHLKEAGLTSYRKTEGNYSYIWISGVRLKPEHMTVPPDLPIEVTDFDYYGDDDSESIPESIKEVESKLLPRTHIQILGGWYAKNLLATLKLMKRPFTHGTTGQLMTHIVTFSNPEMRHIYLTEEEADAVQKQLL